jgi:polyphosphate kinase
MSETAASRGEGPEAVTDLHAPVLYGNREIGLLAFQRRVLEEARDPSAPLLERLKFLSIVGSNLDEFFMVRVAGLKQQIEAGVVEAGPDGMSPVEQLLAVRRECFRLMTAARELLRDDLVPALAREEIRIVDHAALTEDQKAWSRRYFDTNLFPVLTPLAVDVGRPFPHISNLALNLAVTVRDAAGKDHFARVKVPGTLPQMVSVPPEGGAGHVFVPLEQVVAANLGELFPGLEVVVSHPFRVTRNADVVIQELEAGDLLETIAEGIRQRQFGFVSRLSVNADMPKPTLDLLVRHLDVDEEDIYRVEGPLALGHLAVVCGVDRPDLKDAPFQPARPARLGLPGAPVEVAEAMRRGDILLHHPYDSFAPVVEFLRWAATDADVLAIKMTLYRVGRNAPVVQALMDARENGKQVSVLVELKARFDEERNIEWARALEDVGCHVVYGVPGLKTHSKVAMVVRKEGDRLRRYLHLSTGNYNAVTAQLYTDLGLLTCDEELGADATDLFNFLTGYSAKSDYRKMLVAPVNLRERLGAMILREMEHARRGEAGHLIFKMNSLVDSRMIRLLYEASRAGVRVDLIVRGICCLRPGIAGVSEHVRVTSIVGRFLEHTRVYYFRNGGDEQVLLGSADLMPRNINGRVEVLFPIRDPRLVELLRYEVLGAYLADNVKARVMRPDGGYERVVAAEGEQRVSSQEWFLRRRGGPRTA